MGRLSTCGLPFAVLIVASDIFMKIASSFTELPTNPSTFKFSQGPYDDVVRISAIEEPEIYIFIWWFQGFFEYASNVSYLQMQLRLGWIYCHISPLKLINICQSIFLRILLNPPQIVWPQIFPFKSCFQATSEVTHLDAEKRSAMQQLCWEAPKIWGDLYGMSQTLLCRKVSVFWLIYGSKKWKMGSKTNVVCFYNRVFDVIFHSSKGSDSFWFIIEDSPQTRQISLKQFHIISLSQKCQLPRFKSWWLDSESKNPWGTLQSDLENAQQQREDLMQAGRLDGFMYDTHGR